MSENTMSLKAQKIIPNVPHSDQEATLELPDG